MPKRAKPKMARQKPKAIPLHIAPPVTTPIVFRILISSVFIMAMFLWTLQSNLRIVRLWLNQDEFERHKLAFSVEGVPAEWGYAAWTGLFGENMPPVGWAQAGSMDELLQKNIPPVLNHNIEGGPLVVNAIAFPSGIGTHAPGKIAFSLQGKFSRFSCRVGLDAASIYSKGAIYSVVADGREIFRSPKLQIDVDPFPIDVSVTGVHELVLNAVQTEFENTHSDVDWVDLKFTP